MRHAVPPITAVPAARYHYLQATRHPWPSLLFLLPLLAVYECGVFWLGGSHPDEVRNGADAWLRWWLEAAGLRPLYLAPALVLLALGIWSWQRRKDPPRDLLGVCTGMALESVFFALGLWGIGRGLLPLLDHLGITLQVPGEIGARPPVALAPLITFVGAGIYEEVLFRLFLIWGLMWTLSLLHVPTVLRLLLAGLAAAVSFAAAHHVGPYGEPFDPLVFGFRAFAGLYFTALFLGRGFGIAVGAHALYDVLAGLAVG
ncbi:MAG: CPBP family glutamic-type intramembrane protease [Gemmataceae bacterium]